MKMKKIISILLACMMLLTVIPAYAENETVTEEEQMPQEEIIEELLPDELTGKDQEYDVEDDIIIDDPVAPEEETPEENTDEENTETEEPGFIQMSSMEFDALRTMGMIDDDFASLSADAPVSRARFLGALSKVAGFTPASYPQAKIPFIDVSMDTLHKDDICYFHENGYIDGTTETTFSPHEYITYAQVVKIILDVCRYKTYVEAGYGLTLDGYTSMAWELDLFDGVKNYAKDKAVTAEDAVRLLFNAGNLPIMTVSGVTANGGVNWTANDNETLFAHNSDIYFGEGLLRDNGLVSIDGESASSTRAKIDNESFVLDNLNLYDLIGCKVDYAYKDENGTKTLLWARCSDDVEILEINADDIEPDSKNYSMECIVYWDDKDLEEADISSHATIIYNNSIYNDAGLDKLKPAIGKIVLIDNDDDDVADTVVIEEFRNIFVTSTTEAFGGVITDKYGPEFEMDDYEEVQIYKDGESVDFGEIPTNTIITALIDRNQRLAVLHVNGSGKTGKMVSYTSKRNSTVYEFENETLTVSASYLQLDEKGYQKITPVSGRTYTYYLDRNGRIAEIQGMDTGALEYALMINAGPSDEGDANAAWVKLMLTNGTILTAYTHTKVKLDGVTGKSGKNILEDTRLYNAETGEFEEQIVRVAFNEDGKIRQFEFANDLTGSEYGYDENTFSHDYTGESYYGSYGGVKRFGKYTFTNNTPVFVHYTNLDVDSAYAVTTAATLVTYKQKMKLYDVDRTMTPAIAFTTLDGQYKLGTPFLVSDIFWKVIDGEAYKVVGGYYQSGYLEYPEITPGVIPEDLKRGDVITLSALDGFATGIEKFTSLADNPEPKYEGTYNNTSKWFGYVYSMSEYAIVMLAPDSYRSHGKVIPMALSKSRGIPVTVYDVEADTIQQGRVADIVPSGSINSDGSINITDESAMVLVSVNSSSVVSDIILVKY